MTTVTTKTLAHIALENTTCSTIFITGTNTHTITTGCSITTGNAANSITLYRPTAASVTTGDVLVAEFGARRKTATGLAGPAGWTKVTSATTTGGGYTNFLAAYVCVVGRAANCTKTQTTWTWTWSVSTPAPVTSTNASGGILEFTGVTPATPVNVGTTKANAPSKWTTATILGVTTTQYDTQLVGGIVSGGTQTFHTTGACHVSAGTVRKLYTNRNTTGNVTYRHDSATRADHGPGDKGRLGDHDLHRDRRDKHIRLGHEHPGPQPAVGERDGRLAPARAGPEAAVSVGEGGLEPPHPFGHRNLNPARLPIPPLARVTR